MGIAISHHSRRFGDASQPAEPPIHWPAAIIGLIVAIGIVVGVSWLATLRRPDQRPPTHAASPAAQESLAVAPTPIPAPVLQPTPAPAERVTVAQTRGLGVNLRAMPGEKSARIKTLPEGTQLEVVGPDERIGGVVWRNVRDPGGTVGWVAASFLKNP